MRMWNVLPDLNNQSIFSSSDSPCSAATARSTYHTEPCIYLVRICLLKLRKYRILIFFFIWPVELGIIDAYTVDGVLSPQFSQSVGLYLWSWFVVTMLVSFFLLTVLTLHCPWVFFSLSSVCLRCSSLKRRCPGDAGLHRSCVRYPRYVRVHRWNPFFFRHL